MWSVILMAIGVQLKQWRHKMSNIGWVLLIAGLFFEMKYINEYHNAINDNYGATVLVLLSLIISCWSIVACFIGFDFIKPKKLLGNHIVNFLIIALIFGGFSALIWKYYLRSLNAIVSTGSLFVADGISYIQMAKLIDDKIWQATMLLSLLTVIVALLIFFLQRTSERTHL